MPTRTTTRRTLILSATLLLPVLAVLGGCWHNEAGPGYSNDTHTYVSTAWRPWTVTLLDTRTGEAVWSADVPVDQQLSIRFRKGAGPGGELPDIMDWGLMKAGTKYGHRKNRLPVPGRDARLLRPTMRAVPEMPGAVLTTAPEPGDEILEVTPIEAPADAPYEEIIDEPMDDEPMPEEPALEDKPVDDAQAPIDLPDGK
jgi:hypothetical protein